MTINNLNLTTIIILIFVNFSKAQTLTEKQKLEDFEYLYQTLKSSYPYFDVLEREHGIKWLDYKTDFEEAIKNAKTDEEFIKTISDILRNLHNGHADLSPTYRKTRYINIYKNTSNRKKWLETIKEGTDLYDNSVSKINTKYETQYDSTLLDCFIIDTNNIAVIKIKSFNTFQIENDIKRIKKFLKKVKDYPNLIIDIQDNSGGSTNYWSNLVSLLSSNDLITEYYYAIRNSNFIKSYFKELKWDKVNFKTIDKLPNIPKELNQSDYFYTSVNKAIKGNKTNNFKGKIFLLVNHIVFSSAESFAVFCKQTKWATVVGETTGGDGIGIDPVISILPNSKILFRFPGIMGLNPDGSSNEEMKTIPDIKIIANSSEERLYNFAKTINPKIQYIYHVLPPILNNCKTKVLIYPTNEKSDSLNIRIKKMIDYFNSKYFHIPDSLYFSDTIALKKDLSNYNIISYGSINGNLWTKEYFQDIPIEITSEYIKTTEKYIGDNLRLITSWFNAKSEGFYVKFYTSQKSEGVLNINNVFHGPTNYVIANDKFEILEKGFYKYENGKYTTYPAGNNVQK